MSFLSLPTMLIAAGIAIPLLLLLYFLKLRRQERTVPSTLLWKKAVQDLQVNAPFQKLRKNLLLLLQLLVLAALLFALGNPVANLIRKPERNVVVLIDRSGSMSTIEADGLTRMEHARRAATDFVADFPEGSQMMIIAFADRAEVVCTFTNDKRRLFSAIDSIEPTDGVTQIGEALQLAVAHGSSFVEGVTDKDAASVESADIHIFSDGRIRDAQEEYSAKAQLVHHQIGAAADNAGIVAFDFQRDLERPGAIAIFAQVENFGPSAIKTDVSLSVDGRMMAVQDVELGPALSASTQPATALSAAALSATTTPPLAKGGKGGVATLPSARNVLFDLQHEAGGLVEIKLHRQDALPLDDVVRAPLDPPRGIRVLVVSDRHVVRFLLQRVFQLALQIGDVTIMSTADYESADDTALALEGRSAFDMVVLDKHDTDRLYPGNYIFFGGIPKIEGVAAGEDVEEQIFVTWREAHPLLHQISLDNIYTLRWQRLTLPSHAARLVEGEDSVAMAFITDPGHRYVIVAFDLLESDFRMKPAFPMFMQNALFYLAGGGLGDTRGLIRPGDTIALPVPPGANEVVFEDPARNRHAYPVTDRHTVTFARTQRAGPYTVHFDDAEKTTDVFAANVLDSTESRVAPHKLDTLAGAAVTSVSGEARVNEAIWPYAVLAALAVLLFEWWVYNRRVMV